MIPFIGNVHNRQTHRGRKQIARSWGEVSMGSDCLMGKEFACSVMKNFQDEIVVIFAQHCNLLNATELYAVKWLCVVY